MYYTLKDHQGSLAAVIHGNTVERLSYDPWGRRRNTTDFGYDNVTYTFDRGYTLRRNDYGNTRPNQRLYGGKELLDETVAGHSLEWYDFEARMYDPLIGRFLSTDPMAEKYYGLTPYGYCGNNPMNAYDLHGDSISIMYGNGLEIGETVNYFDGKLYNPDGTAFEGKNTFLTQCLEALKTINQSEEGRNMLTELQSSNNMFSIEQSYENHFLYNEHNKAYANIILSNAVIANLFQAEGVDLTGGSGGKVLWNPSGTLLHTTDGLAKNSHTDLAHELFHALDSNRGLLDNKKEQGLSRTEWQASYRENSLRIQLGYPVRTHYQTKTSLVKIVTDNNSPIHPFWY